MVSDLVVLLLAITATLAGLGLVRRRVPLDVLRKQHEVAGVAYAVLAGLYGVILAFVLANRPMKSTLAGTAGPCAS